MFCKTRLFIYFLEKKKKKHTNTVRAHVDISGPPAGNLGEQRRVVNIGTARTDALSS